MIGHRPAVPDDVKSVIHIIKCGCKELLVEDEFIEKLLYSHNTGIPLCIKVGLDPTAPDIHLGHTIILGKLRQLQDLGHKVIFLVGDFTALIGDPSGRKTARPMLTHEEILKNADTYCRQASLILDTFRVEISYNSKWLDVLEMRQLIKLTSCYTVARMIERDDFSQRLRQGSPISVNEFLYPLMQGYDSYILKSDLEIGGTDQKFNLLMGREVQRAFGQRSQCILTMPILEGTNGVEKMSKSKGNYIGVSETPDSMFGKIMSISDTLMWHYFELLSCRNSKEILNIRSEVDSGLNPRQVKVMLAQEVVARFHTQRDAEKALMNFNMRFQGHQTPHDIPEVTVRGSPIKILKLLREVGLATSGCEAQRNLEQGGVKIDGSRVVDKSLKLTIGTYVVQVGKRRFTRVIVLE